jgi:hypothetical protein
MSRNKPQNVDYSSGTKLEKGASFSVGSNSHAVRQDADKTLWDTVSDIAVLPEDTNIKAPK